MGNRRTESSMVPSVWLATYMRSGTTWTRFLLHELLVGPVRRSADLDEGIPSIHANDEAWRHHLDRGGVLATHKAHPQHTERYGTALRGFVHVVRHPADVLLSEARFFCLLQAGDIERREGHVDPERLEKLLSDYLTVLLHSGRTEKHGRIGMGSWAEHTASWLDARHDLPHILVRYEDLSAAPVGELRRVAAFFGIEASDDELAVHAERCSARSLRAMQEQEIARRETGRFYDGKPFDAAYDLGLRFLGPARVGDGNRLGPAALERIEALFGEVMARVGYRIDPEAPVVPAPDLRSVRALDPPWLATVTA